MRRAQPAQYALPTALPEESGREAPAAGTSGRSYREEEKKKRLIVLLQKVPRLSSEPQREAFSRAHGEITRIHFINVDVV